MPRVKRPIPDRDGPIRSWASAVAPEPQNTPRDNVRPGPDISPDSHDPIVRGVVSGGRVVDEWIRQAQQAARLLGGTSAAGGWPDASGRMFRATSDLVAAWLAILGLPQQNGVGGWGGPQPGTAYPESDWRTRSSPEPVQTRESRPSGPSEMDPEMAATTGPRVRLDVSSRRPVEVTVDLHRRGVTRFRVLDLRAERGNARRIQGTDLEPWAPDGVRLHLAVPDDQPPGTYHAVILDAEADCAVGTVTLRIRD